MEFSNLYKHPLFFFCFWNLSYYYLADFQTTHLHQTLIVNLNVFLNNLSFSSSVNIGLTAGASAPETLVQVLISKLRKNFNVNLINHEVIKEDIVFNLPKLLRQ